MSTRIALCGRLEVELRGERVEGRLPGRQGPQVLALPRDALAAACASSRIGAKGPSQCRRKLTLSLTTVVTDPAGNRRTVRNRVVVRLKAAQR